MTEKRWYYTDPLAAAWMAKHHGMQYARGDQCVIGWADFAEIPPLRWDAPFHILRDSLPLLEPQIGDLALCEIDDMNHPEAEFKLVTYDPKLFDARHGICRILMRAGKAFFWPESEAA